MHADKGKHIITSSIEHKAVLDVCAHLEKQGFDVTYLTPQSDGRITTEQVQNALREDTVLVSVMYVNNELGCVNPIKEIAKVCHDSKVLLHTDAAQAIGKFEIDVNELDVDLLSICAHKFYGPKGIGALYVKRGVKVAEQIHGGGHERGMRSGTLATHQIVGLGEAAQICNQNMEADNKKLIALREQLKTGLLAIDGASLNGSDEYFVPGILNVSFAGVDGESLLLSLPQLAVSSGSACNSATMAPSYVLKAIGLDDDLAHASIRFSLGRFSDSEQITQAVEHVATAVERLKGMAA
jgi:cysteine desulfurase